jgi:hypothetical protein
MYVQPVLFPQFSNREDFLSTISIFDDDTGSPINLSGITLAPGNPNGLTAAAWTVKDGNIATASATSITIPPYPVGNQLSALALTVAPGLGILPGDPVVITDTATGLNSMAGYVISYAIATGALVCQIGLTFQFEIRHGGTHLDNSGYTMWIDVSVASGDTPLLSATLGNGITIIDVGFLQVRIPESQFRRLCGRTYLACMTMTDSIDTRQIFIGKLPVLGGGVTQ